MAAAAVVSKFMPGNAFVFFFGVSIFGGLYAWAQIFATHLRYLAWHRANPSMPRAIFTTQGRRMPSRRELKTGIDESTPASASQKVSLIDDLAPWRTACSAFGLAIMVAIILTTWFVPGLRVTLVSGVPWLLLLTGAWGLKKLKAGEK